MAYSVAQRTREIGIRIAVGADSWAVRNLVVWQTIVGTTLGISVAFATAHLIAGFLFGVKPWDPVAFLSAPLILSLWFWLDQRMRTESWRRVDLLGLMSRRASRVELSLDISREI